MLVIDTIAPGTSSGWYRHSPGIAFLTKGTSETWAATETGCAKIEENVAGDAVSHVHHDLHLTAIPADSEPATFIGLYWGMGSDRTAKPGVCTHSGCLVSDVRDGAIHCYCHGSRFRITDGSVATGPALLPLPIEPITVRNGTIRRTRPEP